MAKLSVYCADCGRIGYIKYFATTYGGSWVIGYVCHCVQPAQKIKVLHVSHLIKSALMHGNTATSLVEKEDCVTAVWDQLGYVVVD